MTILRFLKSKKFLISIGVLALVILALVGLYYIGKPNVEIIEGGATVRGESWHKIVDKDLGIEVAFPPDFGLTIEHTSPYLDPETGEITRSLRLYRQIGFGERLHCNESGEAHPHALSDPDLYLGIEDRSLSEWLDDWGIDSLEYFVSSNGGEVKLFNDGRKYYEWVHGVEMCNSRTTIVPLDDGRLAVFDEPLISDIGPAITEQGKQTLEELLAGRPPFGHWNRELIFASVKSLYADPEKAQRNEIVSEFKPQDDSFESREQAQALGMTPREFYMRLAGGAYTNPFPRAVVYNHELKLINYPLEWKTSRYIFEIIDTADGSILLDEPGGHVSPEFIDIDQNGVHEIKVSYDGGGNTDHCNLDLYRFFRTTERDIAVVPINFIRNTEVYQTSSPELDSTPHVDCDWGGRLELENGKYVYKGVEWKRANDPRVDPESWICDQEEVRYEYDGENFREVSRSTILAGENLKEYGRKPSCYMPAEPAWLR